MCIYEPADGIVAPYTETQRQASYRACCERDVGAGNDYEWRFPAMQSIYTIKIQENHAEWQSVLNGMEEFSIGMCQHDNGTDIYT